MERSTIYRMKKPHINSGAYAELFPNKVAVFRHEGFWVVYRGWKKLGTYIYHVDALDKALEEAGL